MRKVTICVAALLLGAGCSRKVVSHVEETSRLRVRQLTQTAVRTASHFAVIDSPVLTLRRDSSGVTTAIVRGKRLYAAATTVDSTSVNRSDTTATSHKVRSEEKTAGTAPNASRLFVIGLICGILFLLGVKYFLKHRL